MRISDLSIERPVFATVLSLLLIVLGVQQAVSSCHVEEPWLTAWRGLATYTVPKVDV